MAIGFIKIYNFADFLNDLGKPVAWSEEESNDVELRERFINELNLPIFNDF